MLSFSGQYSAFAVKEVESQYIDQIYDKWIIRQYAQTGSRYHLWPHPVGHHDWSTKSRKRMRKSPRYEKRHPFQNPMRAAIKMSQHFARYKKEILFLVINFAGIGTPTHAYVGLITSRREGKQILSQSV